MKPAAGMVRRRRAPLQYRISGDHLTGHQILPDAEVLERALGLRSPEFVRGNLDFAEVVGFDLDANRLPQGQWELIGGPEASDAPLKTRQRMMVYDARLGQGSEVSVPTGEGMTPWLYVMDGAVTVGDARLGKGDAVTDLDGALPTVRAESAATLVAFLVDRAAPASTAGTISGR